MRPDTRDRFRAWVLAAAAAVLAGCASAGRPAPAPAPPAPATFTLDTAAIGGLADLLRMEDRRALELERWSALLGDGNPVLRSRAVLAAGRIADPRATPLVRQAATDTVAAIRATAAFALGRLADTTAAGLAALQLLLQGRDSAALEAPAALARVNTPAAYQALRQRLEGLGRATAPFELRLAREGLLALWRFRERPGAAELAEAFLRSRDSGVRWAATYVLVRTGTPASVLALINATSDPDPLVRATAARGLRPGAADTAGQGPAVRNALRQLLADASPHVRISSARALAAFRIGADVVPLSLLLQDADGNVRLAVVEALGSYPDDGAAAGALRALAADTSAPLATRAAALAGMARGDGEAALRVAGEWAEARDWLQRFYAVRGVAGIAEPLKLDLLRKLARDPDGRVQGEAFGALAAADSSAPLTLLFLEGLAAPDPIVRANAAAGLGRRRDPAFYSALMQAFERAGRDTINDAALAAVDALAELAERGVPVATSFFLRFRPSPDPVVRARVALRLGSGGGTWGEPRPIATGRDDDFYGSVVRTLVAPVLAGAAPPRVRIRTGRGDIVLALDPAAAPLTVDNFLALIDGGFYRRPGLRWHRVVPNFVLQDGDPRGDGSGGPARVIRDEINLLRYDRGALGMALSGPDTGGSQFFITHSPQPHLDGGYTIFGRVVEGMTVADAIVQDDPILAIEAVR